MKRPRHCCVPVLKLPIRLAGLIHASHTAAVAAAAAGGGCVWLPLRVHHPQASTLQH